MTAPARSLLLPESVHATLKDLDRGYVGDSELDPDPTVDMAQDFLSCYSQICVDGRYLYQFQFPRERAVELLGWVKATMPEHFDEISNPSCVSEILTGTLLGLRKDDGYPVIHPTIRFRDVMAFARDAQRALLFFGWNPVTDLNGRQREVLSRTFQDKGIAATADQIAMALAITDPDPFARNDAGYTIAFS